MNELKIFEGQEVRITTNEGNTIINLVHVAKCCGLTTVANSGNEVVRFKRVKERLEKILQTDVSANIKEEINYILEEIENSDDRNQIYMSSWLSKRLALECHSEKAMRFKNFLVSLDEERENKLITPINQTTQVQAAQLLQVVTAGLHEFVKDSIRIKDSQIDEARELIGLRDRNTKNLTGKLKEGLFKAHKRTIPASHYLYIKAKKKVFAEFKVTKWEEIPVGKYNAVFAYIENMDL